LQSRGRCGHRNPALLSINVDPKEDARVRGLGGGACVPNRNGHRGEREVEFFCKSNLSDGVVCGIDVRGSKDDVVAVSAEHDLVDRT